jgi:hypothetical protein
MKKILIIIFFLFYLCGASFGSQELDFTIQKLNSNVKGPTLLIVAGIQGDEPGGFNAASILSKRYKITTGNIWIISNLNSISIINRTRGVFGDLNRKFAKIKAYDPEYETVEKIKALILNKQVDMVLNLHDGSGFFRDKYKDDMHNPDRWGQCIIIDQKSIQNEKYGNLKEIAEKVIKEINVKIGYGESSYHINNTKTKEGNIEMSKTLTYFAIKNLKSAFGIEASKNYFVHTRVYYHLIAIEAFMNYLNIGYLRDFNMTESGVKAAIKENILLSLFNKKIILDLENSRQQINYLPLKKNAEIEFESNDPIVAVVKKGAGFDVFHGNRNITSLYPEYFEYDNTLSGITIEVDGKIKKVEYGSIVNIEKNFKILMPQDFRVNIIGFIKKNAKNEAGILIIKKNIIKRFSIDKKGLIYRVEVYRKGKFSGMILVKFK